MVVRFVLTGLVAMVLACPNEDAMVAMGESFFKMSRMREMMVSRGIPEEAAKGFTDKKLDEGAQKVGCELDRNAKEEKHT
jgi:hypothetical protein